MLVRLSVDKEPMIAVREASVPSAPAAARRFMTLEMALDLVVCGGLLTGLMNLFEQTLRKLVLLLAVLAGLGLSTMMLVTCAVGF